MQAAAKSFSTEKQLIEGCCNNSRHHQKLLFDKYKDAMFTLCFRILNDNEEASDALQEGFLEVFRCIHRFEGRSTLGAWIKKIMVRTAYRKLNPKSSGFNCESLTMDHDKIAWPEHLSAFDPEIAIKNLPPNCRSVFVLAEIEGFTHKEIGDMLGITEGTSKSQLSHAKKLLRKALKSYQYDK